MSAYDVTSDGRLQIQEVCNQQLVFTDKIMEYFKKHNDM